MHLFECIFLETTSYVSTKVYTTESYETSSWNKCFSLQTGSHELLQQKKTQNVNYKLCNFPFSLDSTKILYNHILLNILNI